MNRYPLGIVLVLLLFPGSAIAQVDRWSVDIGVGSLDHLTELHRYHQFSFENEPVLGIGASARIMGQVSGRIMVEAARPRLSGSRIYERREHDQENLLLTAQLQVLGTKPIGRMEPFAGVGLGIRRYKVNSYIISDDIIHAPWASPQIQPIGSVVGGLRFAVGAYLSVAADARWSWARFRVAEDTWGLPADPVQTQREFQPTLRLELSPR